MTHLGDRIAALVDGELGHQDRDRALAHVAHCARCRAGARRAAGGPCPAGRQRRPGALGRDGRGAAVARGAGRAAAAAGPHACRRARSSPSCRRPGGSAAPGRAGPGPQRAANRADSRRPGDAAARRARSAGRGRLVAASALSVAGLVLGTAFVAGGAEPGGGPVVPPVAQLTVEHGRTATAVTVGDPAFGLTAGLTGLPSGAGEPTSSGR